MQQKRIDNSLSSRERAIEAGQVLKMHKNLDLKDYKKYVSYFQKYSKEWFDQESIFETEINNSFTKKKSLSPTQKLLKSSKLTGEALFKQIKLTPLTEDDKITVRQIQSYNKLGNMGWEFIGSQILHNKHFADTLDVMSKILNEQEGVVTSMLAPGNRKPVASKAKDQSRRNTIIKELKRFHTKNISFQSEFAPETSRNEAARNITLSNT